MNEHTRAVGCLAVSPADCVVSAGWDGSIKVWNVTTGDVRNTGSHRGPIRCVAVLADGNIVSGGDDNIVKVWAPERSTPACQYPADARVTALAVYGAQRGVVAGLGDGRVIVLAPQLL
jgi:WD40 repeat protein